jgi:hypothetical protein
MKLLYKEFLEKWELTLDLPILDPAFVVKARDFEAAIAEKRITDEEIQQTDKDLLEMLQKEHKFEEVDSPEVIKERRKNRILEARQKISDAETLEAINSLTEEYNDINKDLKEFIAKRVEKVRKAMDDAAASQFNAEALQVIEDAQDTELEGLLQKYADHPDLIKKIQARIAKIQVSPAETLRDKILSRKQREWSFSALKELGIPVSGDSFEFEGIYFERQYLFKVYHIKKVDGNKV